MRIGIRDSNGVEIEKNDTVKFDMSKGNWMHISDINEKEAEQEKKLHDKYFIVVLEWCSFGVWESGTSKGNENDTFIAFYDMDFIDEIKDPQLNVTITKKHNNQK